MRRVIVSYQVKEGKGLALVKAFLESEAVKNIRNEEGCIQYEYYVSAENPEDVKLIEMWENRELHEAHLAGPNMAPLAEIKKQFTNGQSIEVYDFDADASV